ncbi:GDSL-type esterase/lipase family protein [Streptomyces caniscabiei]|uniref:GDSL-type esterase/lipase family protein n=1 Tax=Streptomyces caniscabiei TaxID=2746961 RepID=UPI0029B631B3|nr:GDSL-type esterase/lipase family protein [Streptomyces caniscabiei]MDX2604973.1 GDSL-type esterase/lipase family protein [Streptomyces caniscabiei]MDX2733861.1 GDSL-type esterase/lipase family protein [Streptomyces caniscabiei]MDX2779933.1 GDSL-type esterase/lipase family protein [Streptomyces caniscabiei]
MRNLRILITSALVIALSSLGLSAASAADRVATNCTSASRAQAPAARAVAAPVTVWLAGDSTMANPSSGRCPVGWGSQFDALFNNDVTVRNQAVGGRSIQTWLYEGNVSNTKGSDGECRLTSTTYSSRWQAMLNSSTGMKAGDYLFIQFGINDSSSTCPRHVGPARYRQLMTTMVQAALARGAHPVLLTPVAAITCSGGTATKNRGFVNETFAVGSTTRAPVVDLQSLSVSLYNSLRFCPNNGDYGGSGPLGTFFCDDHTHFDTYGAQRIAGLVAGDVRRQNLPLAAYLR